MAYLKEVKYKKGQPLLSIVEDRLEDKRIELRFKDAESVRYFFLKEVK